MNISAFSLPRIRIRPRRSRPVIWIAAALAVVSTMAALTALYQARVTALEQARALEAQSAALAADNAWMEQAIAQNGTVQGITEIARRELGLVEPGSIVFIPESR